MNVSSSQQWDSKNTLTKLGSLQVIPHHSQKIHESFWFLCFEMHKIAVPSPVSAITSNQNVGIIIINS